MKRTPDGITVSVSVKLDVGRDFAGLTPEQIDALMHGIGLVLAANASTNPELPPCPQQ